MKRDLDLMRKILLRIEAQPEVPPKTLIIEDFLDLCDNPQVLSLHIGLLRDSGLIETAGESYDGDVRDYDIARLTFNGYEYLDSVRSAKVWKAVRERLSAIGGATLEIVMEVAAEQVKKELGLQ